MTIQYPHTACRRVLVYMGAMQTNCTSQLLDTNVWVRLQWRMFSSCRDTSRPNGPLRAVHRPMCLGPGHYFPKTIQSLHRHHRPSLLVRLQLLHRWWFCLCYQFGRLRSTRGRRGAAFTPCQINITNFLFIWKDGVAMWTCG